MLCRLTTTSGHELALTFSTISHKADREDLSALSFPVDNRGREKDLKRKTPYGMHRKGLRSLVAGKGFEPMTFGL